jgi:hypothetical protein
MSAPLDGPTEDMSPVPSTGPRTIESKLVVSTVVATLLYGMLGAIQANTAVLDFLPSWAQAIVVTVLPTLLAALAGWQTKSNRV